MWETTTLMVSYNTPLQTIEQLKMRLRAWMAENSREWGCEFTFRNSFCGAVGSILLLVAPGCEVNISQVGVFPFQNDGVLTVRPTLTDGFPK